MVMNFNENLITEKVFKNHQFKMITHMLGSQKNGVLKAENYYNKCFATAVLHKEILPCDLVYYIEILQKSILIPKGDHLQNVTVFFSFSKHTQYNILIFLQDKMKTMPSKHVTQWIEFLSYDHEKQDKWLSVILNFHKNIYTNHEPILSKSSINRLSKVIGGRGPISKQGVVQEHFVEEQEIEQSFPLAKRFKVNNSDDTNVDDISKVGLIKSICEGPDLCLETPSKQFIKMSQCEAEPNINKYDLIPNVISQPVHPVIEEINISTIEIDLQGNITENVCEKILVIFLEHSTKDLGSVCKQLRLDEIDELIFENLFNYLTEKDSLSFEKMKIIIYYGITARISYLNDLSVSRSLFSLAVKIFEKCRRIALFSILAEIIALKNFKKCHEEFLKRLIAGNLLQTEDIKIGLEHAFLKLHVKLSENLISAVDTFLQQKPCLSDKFIETFLQICSQQKGELVKSLKFMKLLMTLLKHYQAQMKHHLELLNVIIENNSTFLKKKVHLLLNKLL